MRTLLALLALLMVGSCVAPAPSRPDDDEVSLPAAMAAQCEEEGGCVVMTRRALQRIVNEVAEAEKRACRRQRGSTT